MKKPTKKDKVSSEAFMAELMAQEKAQRAEDVRTGALINAEAFGMTDPERYFSLRENRIFNLDVAGVPHYPAFFKDSCYNRQELEHVCQAMGSLPGGFKWNFFMVPRFSLGGKTPLEILTGGSLKSFKDALIAAAAFADE